MVTKQVFGQENGGSKSKEGAQPGQIAVNQGTETNCLNWKKERMGTGGLKDAERFC